MKLSELVARCSGDPELMIEDEDGVPCTVAGIEYGLTITPEGPARCVLLEPKREAWHDEEDEPVATADAYQTGEDFIAECASCDYRERNFQTLAAAKAAADAHVCHR
jgi:hypothetical protein